METRVLGDERLLHDTRTGAVHVMNAVAYRVWELCDGTRGLDDLERALRQTYDVPEGVDVRSDLERVLNVFRDKDLIEPSSS